MLNLTEAEKNANYKHVWLPVEEAKEIFGEYEKYHHTDIALYGLYRREYEALKALDL